MRKKIIYEFFKTIYFLLLFITPSIGSFIFCHSNYREELLEKSSRSIQFSHTPFWVEPVNYETGNYEDNIVSPGVAYLLINKQFNVEEKVGYMRKVHKIVSKTALSEASQISFCFSREAELIMHSLKIIRDNRVIDKLATARRQIFYPNSGDTEVFFYVDNLHAGDILDFSCSFKFKPDKLLGDVLDLKECALYKKIAYSCLVGENKPLFWKTCGFEQKPICSINALYKKYSWEINDYKTHYLPTNDFPEPSSSQRSRDASITISTSSWSDIAKYCAVHLYEKTHFSSDPPQNIVELIQEWQGIYPAVESQILAAIRLVSDDIYYASIPDEKEEHTVTPYAPEKTLENYYGDCKDKSMLLIAILKLLDIEAYPVLVNTEKNYELKKELPNPFFDHVIVTIEHNGLSYFVDPTQPLLGGTLETYQIPDFGYGLVIKEDTEDLVPIRRNFLSQIRSTSTLFIESANGTWDCEEQFFHDIANNIRQEVVPGYINKNSKDMLTHIRNFFSTAEVISTSPLQIKDDRQANVITKNFALSLKNLGRKTPTETFYDLTPLISPLAFSIGNIDLLESHSLEKSPRFIQEVYRVINIHCDKPASIEEKKIRYIDENISYSFTLEKVSDTHIRVIFHQKFFLPFIDADQLPQFIKKLEEFKGKLSLIIEIPD